MVKSAAVDLSEAAASLGHLLKAFQDREITAPQGVIDRFEGAYLTLVALSEGRCPSVEDFYGSDKLSG